MKETAADKPIAKMIISRQCACGQTIEFEAEDLATLNCEYCGRSLHEQFAPPKQEPPRFDAAPPAPEWPAIDTTPVTATYTERTIEAVRAESCYKTLRGLIDFVIGTGLVLVGLFALASLIVAVTNRDKGEMVIMSGVAAVFVCAVGVVLLVALRQALLLGVDVADVMIADRADRRAARTGAVNQARKEAALDK